MKRIHLLGLCAVLLAALCVLVGCSGEAAEPCGHDRTTTYGEEDWHAYCSVCRSYICQSEIKSPQDHGEGKCNDIKSGDAALARVILTYHPSGRVETIESIDFDYSDEFGARGDCENATSVTIEAVTNHEKATVANEGTYDLQEGWNFFYLIVTAENGKTEVSYGVDILNLITATPTPAPTPSAEPAPSAEPTPKPSAEQEKPAQSEQPDPTKKPESTKKHGNLSSDTSLRLFTATFGGGQTANMEDAELRQNIVISGQTTVNVTAIPNHDKATVSGDVGNMSLHYGQNDFVVYVTAEDGTVEAHTFIVHNREPKPDATPAPEPEQHEHTWGYDYDEEMHWQTCSCGAESSSEGHQFGDISFDQCSSCLVCGYWQHTGYTYTYVDAGHCQSRCQCGVHIETLNHDPSYDGTECIFCGTSMQQ